MKKTIVTRKMLDTPFEQLSESEQEARRAWNIQEANLDSELRRAREHVKDICKSLLDRHLSSSGKDRTSENTIPAAGWIQPLEHLHIQLEALNLWLASYGLQISLDSCNDHFGLPKIQWHIKKFQRSRTLRLASKLCHLFSSKLLEKEKEKEEESKDSGGLFEDLKKTLASSLSTLSSVLGKHRETISSKVLSEAVSCLCEKLCEEARGACETRCKHCGKIQQPASLLCVAEDLSLLCKECAAASGLSYKDPAEDNKLFQNAEMILEADEMEEGL